MGSEMCIRDSQAHGEYVRAKQTLPQDEYVLGTDSEYQSHAEGEARDTGRKHAHGPPCGPHALNRSFAPVTLIG